MPARLALGSNWEKRMNEIEVLYKKLKLTH